jgi:hypothetical protein
MMTPTDHALLMLAFMAFAYYDSSADIAWFRLAGRTTL